MVLLAELKWKRQTERKEVPKRLHEIGERYRKLKLQERKIVANISLDFIFNFGAVVDTFDSINIFHSSCAAAHIFPIRFSSVFFFLFLCCIRFIYATNNNIFDHKHDTPNFVTVKHWQFFFGGESLFIICGNLLAYTWRTVANQQKKTEKKKAKIKKTWRVIIWTAIKRQYILVCFLHFCAYKSQDDGAYRFIRKDNICNEWGDCAPIAVYKKPVSKKISCKDVFILSRFNSNGTNFQNFIVQKLTQQHQEPKAKKEKNK